MGALSRNKGAGGERELARLLADELGTEVVRNLSQARSGGADLIGVEGWAIEVKRAAKVTPGLLRAWWAQAEAQATRACARPALAFRGDREPWRIAVRLWDLLALGPAPGWVHDPDTEAPAAGWPGLDLTATLSLPGFAFLIREEIHPCQ